jgi:hypothetical protein
MWPRLRSRGKGQTKVCPLCFLALQCGRGFAAAESQSLIPQFAYPGGASMWPRLRSRGKQPDHRGPDAVLEASMWPRLRSRGKGKRTVNNGSNHDGFNVAAASQPRKGRNVRLRFKEVSRFNVAAASQPRKATS